MKKAFSLVETLSVIAIIVSLVAMLSPAFASVRRSANTGVCISNLKQLGFSVMLYGADYDDALPYGPGPIAKTLSTQGTELDGDPYTDLMRSLPDARVLLTPYTASNAVWKCPLDQISPLLGEGRKPTWFQETGSSYGYDEFDALSGVSVSSVSDPSQRLLMKDEEAYHGSGIQGAFAGQLYNCLLFDSHVKTCPPAIERSYLSNDWWL
jgi:type II secretory pathway pseudopilin PulG